ncbi:hypothetical protein [Sphingobacterium sp. MYb388]|uniref:hypothetical protein n=1 Tax=Sphingobacterium sp. MYb388 TaxID=2745437 RepID=UPI0030A435E0
MIKGKLIGAFGIPGSGKSTTIKKMGEIMNIQTFHEPEEKDWADAVRSRNISGNFTGLMWFRSIRVPQYYKANALRDKGLNTMLDSCYDKLFYLYHDKEGLEWLLCPDDPYYEEVKSISKKDLELLPDLDIIIFFKQTEENWTKFIEKRNRELDKDRDFKKSFILQNAFIEAVEKYCNTSECKLIIHEQSFTDPYVEAKKIIKKLQNHLI